MTANSQIPTAFAQSKYAEAESILVRMARQRSLADLLDCILEEARELTHADGASFYLVVGEEYQRELQFALIYNKTLNFHANAANGDAINIPNIPLFEADCIKNKHNVASYTVHRKRVVNIDDVYLDQKFDFTGAKRFDEKNNYRSKSFLTIPLQDHTGEVIAVMQLVNATDPETGEVVPFDHQHENTIIAMASYASVALDNQVLLDSHKSLLDAFIKSLAGIIDVRSPHTSGHCKRVPVLTELLAQAACEQTTGTYKDYNLTEEEWYELRVAAWMHDCGKLATPDYIVDKSTKLHTLLDGIGEVNERFNALKWQLQLQGQQKISQGIINQKELEQELLALEQDRMFINQCNKGGEFLDADLQQRIKDIALRCYQNCEGDMVPILVPWEVENLCISRGTINEQERAIINRHIEVTIEVLEGLPFPKNLRRVPEYAGGHHEKMNGKGFPRGLTGEQMSPPARMMAVADIFEALTAHDRPYKDPMPLSVSFNIMTNMCNDEHIDSEIFALFLTTGKWKIYAEQFLSAAQRDVTDISPWLDKLTLWQPTS